MKWLALPGLGSGPHPAKLGTGPRIHSETEDRAPFQIAYQQGRKQKVAAETLKTHKKAQPILEFAMDHLHTSEGRRVENTVQLTLVKYILGT